TYMVNNLMFDHKDIDWDNVTQERVDIIEDNIKNEVEKVINYLSKTENILVVVSNEVGMGLVPEYPLGRYYRDIAGRMNQYMGKEASEAYLVVSGIKIKIK
nr:bifunctional adenosylcobinamide kinase/adenosylcobinamide-phosphate guanylyltransferase [Fusobacteriaceae bacterium]